MVERVAYLMKRRLPAVFRLVEYVAVAVVRIRFGARIKAAQAYSRIDGVVGGQSATIRALNNDDLDAAVQFFSCLPDDYFQYFRPHGFSREAFRLVIESRAFLTYGLFLDDKFAGYALLRVLPTGSAFLGLLVSPGCKGLGLGKFLVAYVYWQASVAGLRTRSTISRDNRASLKAHEAVADFKVIAELPDNYIMIEFPRCDVAKPTLGMA
jgi:GNAT superfamily N-acetyltransferase